MNYKETIKYLFAQVPSFQNVGKTGYKEGLDNTLKFDEYLGHPHTTFKTIHIAGTNGKGSCAHTIAAILQEAGYKVGLYTSPHLIDFRERIRVNGKMIEEQYIVDFVEKHHNFFEPLQPSFFELTTAMAFNYFKESNVDIAIIEVGLGGRLDCTNIISPILSIITNISFDHTQFLGDTLAKIAYEKAGIIKEQTPVIIGENNDETRSIFEQKAKSVNAPIIFAEDNMIVVDSKQEDKGGITYNTTYFGELYGELSGEYQIKNTNTILTAILALYNQNILFNEENIREGFAKVTKITSLMGRWHKIQENPLVVCDTGHNPGGFEYIVQQLQKQKCTTMRIIFGMVDDKDISTVVKMLPKNAKYYFTKAQTKRALSEIEVAKTANEVCGIIGQCYKDVNEAYNAALSDADDKDFIYIGGSSYIVADFLTQNI